MSDFIDDLLSNPATINKCLGQYILEFNLTTKHISGKANTNQIHCHVFLVKTLRLNVLQLLWMRPPNSVGLNLSRF